MSVKARDLQRGDVFMLQLRGEVLETAVVANGARVSVKVALLDATSLEFAYGESVIELLAKPGRPYQCYSRRDDDDDRDNRRGGPRRRGPKPRPDPVLPLLKKVPA